MILVWLGKYDHTVDKLNMFRAVNFATAKMLMSKCIIFSCQAFINNFGTLLSGRLTIRLITSWQAEDGIQVYLVAHHSG